MFFASAGLEQPEFPGIRLKPRSRRRAAGLRAAGSGLFNLETPRTMKARNFVQVRAGACKASHEAVSRQLSAFSQKKAAAVSAAKRGRQGPRPAPQTL